MLEIQLEILWALRAAGGATRRRLADDSGEITSTVAIIAVLVVGALAAGAIVVARMKAHAEAIPDPTG
jgi:hypothetical protein